MNDRIPPHDINAEEAAIGSLLLDGAAMREVDELLPSDFYSEPSRLIFAAFVELKDRSEAINQITVAQELDRKGKLEVMGGVAFLSHLVAIVPTSLDLRYYADIVKRLSTARQIVEAGLKITELGYTADPEPSSSLGRADELLLDIRKRTVGTKVIDPESRVRLLGERYEKLYKQEGGVAVSTGLHDLDVRLGGGLFPGDLILLAARTSMGKTTMLQTVANNVGRTDNVLYCTIEMSWQSMGDRDIAGILKLPKATIRLGGYEDQTYSDIIGKGLDELGKRKVYYYDDNPLTASKVMRAGMEMQMRRGLALIVVDYLGIMDDEYGSSPYERLGFISRKMKQVARVLDVPVLAAHQLNRALEMRSDKIPQLHDLRDSGNLEEDADVVMFLYRDNYYDMEIEDTTTQVLLAKVRMGESGRMVKIAFDREGECYRGLAHEERR